MASRPYSTGALALLAGALLVAAPPVHAQGSGDGFLFRTPAATLTVHAGFDHANAGGDVFSFVTDTLTLNRGDFSGFSGGADLSVRLTPRIDLLLGSAYSGRSAGSEYRNWTDNSDKPIQQTTQFQRVPLYAGVKAYLLPQGRSIGRFVWIPAQIAPYVGATGGAMWYRFKQSGDFIDFNTSNLEVFPGDLQSSGWAPMGQVLAGADFTLTPRLALTGEARYSWASATPNDGFNGFDSIDLSGPSASLGLTVRF
ncbi:MAG TPA: hypothetical protein VFL93_03025 [Longimicrobiaceae bacterium]|nr:hypothetical protein [Longimicrobiaceae bacterium]